ncbi:MAG: dTDP-glucose 4,6-dehydratase [Patescibacteria group bacterium]
MKLLVTGGAGFIGSNFINHILTTYPEYEIVNLDALTYAGDKNSLLTWEKDKRYEFVQGNICDRALVDALLERCDIIVHFAAETHVDRSILDAKSFIETNIMGTFTLLESARAHGNKRVHHISTDEVFGSLGENDVPFDELTPYDPRSPYSASKASGDHLVMAYHHTYGLPVTISNCSNNYGPFHFPEKLFPLAITNLLENKKVPVYGDGLQVRDWLYVEDHCKAIDLIIHKGKIGEKYCVGGNHEIKNIDAVKKIISILGKDESNIEYVDDRPGHDRRYAISNNKIIRELGWKPETTFDEGLRKTISWYQENEAWWKSKKKI